MGTARDLTITSWPRERSDLPLTVAVPGLKFTGWWPALPPPIRAFEDIRLVWPPGVAIKLELDIFEDPDGQKHQVCAYVRIHQYPDDWLNVVRDSLKYFVDRGAAISWTGGWECFLRYSSTEAFRGCYAAFTKETGLIGGADLDEPIKYLDQVPAVIKRLHRGVAEAMRSQEAV